MENSIGFPVEGPQDRLPACLDIPKTHYDVTTHPSNSPRKKVFPDRHRLAEQAGSPSYPSHGAARLELDRKQSDAFAASGAGIKDHILVTVAVTGGSKGIKKLERIVDPAKLRKHTEDPIRQGGLIHDHRFDLTHGQAGNVFAEIRLTGRFGRRVRGRRKRGLADPDGGGKSREGENG